MKFNLSNQPIHEAWKTRVTEETYNSHNFSNIKDSLQKCR